MRIRTIKPQFWQHRMHKVLSEFDALLALALLNYADDEGRFIAEVECIKALCFTYRPVAPEALEASLQNLARTQWLTLYEAEIDGIPSRIGCVLKFKDHQTINKPQKSSLPSPKKAASTVSLPDHSRDGSGSTTTPLRESSEDPENHPGVTATGELPGVKEGRKGKERKEEEGCISREAIVFDIVAAYPIRTDQAEAERAVVEAIEAGEDPTFILAGTRAIAAVIAGVPSGSLNRYLPSPTRFFRERKYRDDPAVWRARFEKNAAGVAKAFATEAPQPGLKAKIL
jgi:hypothetical protein